MISSPFHRAGVAVLALWAAMVQAVPPERVTITYELKRNGTVLVDVSETLQMQGTAQDPLSLAYSFAFVPPRGKEYDVTRADGRGLTPFRFTVVGTEKLATPAGEMQTLHIAKLRDGPEDKATDIWFAAE